ncbi:MAG: helix-turn-helix domain-containing protein [Hamadaea sp.]|uniref:helix-turn-helix domain-containing protein n=1 Tax=Hamadaea sp. TaxID=2024425 RepID=UPI00184FB47E|nr:helix-turn-helix domain-containing protein [Hamadaea sp.]NUR70720.1 helix-turn-helix domain-containing protein [Hamadaea sp.]NUT21414.1 helix-turn-helix domain-containing protein [Hamadaea sp.]
MSRRRRDPQSPFGWYLRRLMDSHGFLSDGDLEAASGVSASLISRYQAGEITPTPENLRKLAPVLGVRLGELMVESGLATREELGMVAPPSPKPRVDPVLADAQRHLADPRLPGEVKDYLRATVKGAIAYWRQQLDLHTVPAGPSRPEAEPEPAPGAVRPKPSGVGRR